MQTYSQIIRSLQIRQKFLQKEAAPWGGRSGPPTECLTHAPVAPPIKGDILPVRANLWKTVPHAQNLPPPKALPPHLPIPGAANHCKSINRSIN